MRWRRWHRASIRNTDARTLRRSAKLVCGHLQGVDPDREATRCLPPGLAGQTRCRSELFLPQSVVGTRSAWGSARRRSRRTARCHNGQRRGVVFPEGAAARTPSGCRRKPYYWTQIPRGTILDEGRPNPLLTWLVARVQPSHLAPAEAHPSPWPSIGLGRWVRSAANSRLPALSHRSGPL